MKALGPKAARAVALSAIAIVINCSEPQSETDEREGLSGNEFGMAHAATPVDASQRLQEPVMPANPSQITLRVPKAPKVLVALPGNKAWPYVYSVTEMDDYLFVTLYLPLGEAVMLDVSSLDADGKTIGDPVSIVLEPNAKLGTAELKLDGSDAPIHFSPGAQQSLQMGATVLRGKSTDEFVVSTTDKVMHGILSVEEDTLCQVSWEGCKTVYSFLDEKPEARTEPFNIQLRKGQTFGVYPKLESDAGDYEVLVNLQTSTCP